MTKSWIFKDRKFACQLELVVFNRQTGHAEYGEWFFFLIIQKLDVYVNKNISNLIYTFLWK